jgi:hypothetical protein
VLSKEKDEIIEQKGKAIEKITDQKEEIIKQLKKELKKENADQKQPGGEIKC